MQNLVIVAVQNRASFDLLAIAWSSCSMGGWTEQAVHPRPIGGTSDAPCPTNSYKLQLLQACSVTWLFSSDSHTSSLPQTRLSRPFLPSHPRLDLENSLVSLLGGDGRSRLRRRSALALIQRGAEL